MFRSLVDILEERKLTVAELADKLAVDHSTVWRWTRGKGGPSARQLVELAALLDLTPRYVLRVLEEGAARQVAAAEEAEASARGQEPVRGGRGDV